MASSKQQRLSRALPFLGLLLVGQYAGATENNPDQTQWLNWHAPPECPGTDHIKSRVDEWLPAPLDPDTSLRVEAQVSWADEGWTVSTRVEQGGTVGERQVLVSSCTEAADFVALNVVLAIDPSLAGSLAQAQTTGKEPSPTSAVQAEQAEPAEPPHEEHDPEEKPAAPQAEKPSTSHSAPPMHSSKSHLFIDAGLGAAFIIYPGVQAAWASQVGWEKGAWSFALGARGDLPRSYALDEAANRISFSKVSGTGRGCLSLKAAKLRLGPCAAFEVGRIQSRESGANPTQNGSLWLAILPGFEMQWWLLDWLAPTGGIEMSVPLTPTRFVVNDGRQVHQSSWGVHSWLGLRTIFPER